MHNMIKFKISSENKGYHPFNGLNKFGAQIKTPLKLYIDTSPAPPFFPQPRTLSLWPRYEYIGVKC